MRAFGRSNVVVDEWSLLLDFNILLRTVWICLRGENAY